MQALALAPGTVVFLFGKALVFHQTQQAKPWSILAALCARPLAAAERDPFAKADSNRLLSISLQGNKIR